MKSTSLEWRLSRLDPMARVKIEADIEDGSLDKQELARLQSALTLKDFSSLKEKSAYIERFGRSAYQDILDATDRAREQEAREQKEKR